MTASSSWRQIEAHLKADEVMIRGFLPLKKLASLTNDVLLKTIHSGRLFLTSDCVCDAGRRKRLLTYKRLSKKTFRFLNIFFATTHAPIPFIRLLGSLLWKGVYLTREVTKWKRKY